MAAAGAREQSTEKWVVVDDAADRIPARSDAAMAEPAAAQVRPSSVPGDAPAGPRALHQGVYRFGSLACEEDVTQISQGPHGEPDSAAKTFRRANGTEGA